MVKISHEIKKAHIRKMKCLKRKVFSLKEITIQLELDNVEMHTVMYQNYSRNTPKTRGIKVSDFPKISFFLFHVPGLSSLHNRDDDVSTLDKSLFGIPFYFLSGETSMSYFKLKRRNCLDNILYRLGRQWNLKSNLISKPILKVFFSYLVRIAPHEREGDRSFRAVNGIQARLYI